MTNPRKLLPACLVTCADRSLGNTGRSASCAAGSNWTRSVRVAHHGVSVLRSGIHDGQAALANAIGIRPVVCLDVHMTRNDLASLVLHALPKLHEKPMDLPANDAV